MVTLIKGTKAPGFELVGLDGKRYNLQMTASSTGLVVLAFFKVSCPTCQFTFPFLERLSKLHKTVNIWGVSQDDEGASQGFAKGFGLTFPVLIDHGLSTTVKYDLTTVPTIFRVDKNLAIQQTSIGFVRAELEDLNAEIAKATNQPAQKLFQPSDDAPAEKPG